MPAVYDQVLRALVHQAYEVRGTPAARQACREIVDTHTRWPLVELAVELRWARTVQRRRRVWLAESVALMRDTYPKVQLEREAA